MAARSARELDPRKQVILRAVVRDYVATAEPVGSETLVLRYDLGVKPATVRNELAEMADMGYLFQPHTSAGRVPSNVGYRYYVDRLMDCAPVADSVQERLRGLPETHGELLELLSETCKMLARITRYTSMAVTLNDPTVMLRQIVLSPVSARRLLLVIVLSNGVVENRMFDVPDSTSLEDLGKASEALNAQLVGKPLHMVGSTRAACPLTLGPRSQKIYARAHKLIRSVTRDQARGKLLLAGEMHILEQPEFQRDLAQLESLISALEEESTMLLSLDGRALESVTITIGEENAAASMHTCSIIASRFYAGVHEAGTIGVLGPTRMRYDQAVPVVEMIARSLTDILTRLSSV